MAIKMNGSIRLASFVLTVVIIIVCIAMSWGDHRARADQQKMATEVLKTEGCDVAKVLTVSVAVIKTELIIIKKVVDKLSTDQANDTKEILDAIREILDAIGGD